MIWRGKKTSDLRKNILIHIGKCGGSSVRQAVKKSSVVRIDKVVHIHQPPIRPDAVYYITARDPITRALSAFNWRYKLVLTDGIQRDRFPGEAEILSHYGTLNALAEALYREDGTSAPIAQGHFRSIHHLGESISFYLSDLLSAISREQVGGVLMQEQLEADLKRLFGASLKKNRNENQSATPPEQLDLSWQARVNLRRFLAEDSACLKTLWEWGKISDEAYSLIAGEEELNPKPGEAVQPH